LKPISRRRVSFISFQFRLQPGHGLNEPSALRRSDIERRVGAENESAASRQQTESRTYPRLRHAEGGKNLCESTEYGKLTIACRASPISPQGPSNDSPKAQFAETAGR
jgi:hypothetical protein